MIIGLGGKRGVGKDTLARAFCNQYPQFHQIAFVDYLKSQVMHIFGLSTLQQYDNFKRSDVMWNNQQQSGRFIVQEIGMMLLTNHPLIFIQHAAHQASLYPDLIITDVRMVAEVEWIRSQPQHLLCYIQRPSASEHYFDNHITENAIESQMFDYVIDNNDLTIALQQLDEYRRR